MRGEGGVGQNMILYDTGGGGGLERGQIVLHNTWTAPYASRNSTSQKKGFDENLDLKISCIVTKNVTKIGGKTIGQNILV